MAKVIYEKRDQIAYITLNRPEVCIHRAVVRLEGPHLVPTTTTLQPRGTLIPITPEGDPRYDRRPVGAHAALLQPAADPDAGVRPARRPQRKPPKLLCFRDF
jgi:hypothetical protein